MKLERIDHTMYTDFYHCDITRLLDEACGNKDEHYLHVSIRDGKMCIHIYNSERCVGGIWIDENCAIKRIQFGYDLIGFYSVDINAKLQQFVGEVIEFD